MRHCFLQLGPVFKGQDKKVSKSASSVSMIGWGKRLPMGPVVVKSCCCSRETESCRIASANAAADTDDFNLIALNKCSMARPAYECCELLMLIQVLLGDNIFNQFALTGRLKIG